MSERAPRQPKHPNDRKRRTRATEVTSPAQRYQSRRSGRTAALDSALGLFCATAAEIKRVIDETRSREQNEWPHFSEWARKGVQILMELHDRAPHEERLELEQAFPLLAEPFSLEQLLSDTAFPLDRALIEFRRAVNFNRDHDELRRGLLEVQSVVMSLKTADKRIKPIEDAEFVLYALSDAKLPAAPSRAPNRPENEVLQAFYEGVAEWYRTHGLGSPSSADLADLSLYLGLETEDRAKVRKRWGDRLRQRKSQSR